MRTVVQTPFFGWSTVSKVPSRRRLFCRAKTSRRYSTIAWQKTRILYPRICPYELHRDGVACEIRCVFDVRQDISKCVGTGAISDDRRQHRVNTRCVSDPYVNKKSRQVGTRSTNTPARRLRVISAQAAEQHTAAEIQGECLRNMESARCNDQCKLRVSLDVPDRVRH